MAAKIGIKLADGTFFPIMDDDFSASETLELTTVRDDQRSVQINLFKKEDDISDPSYIGSLIVEDINEKAAGEPTIELHVSLDDEKNLSAKAIDKDSGSHQTLRVSLETFADQSFNDVDFDLSSETADADIDLSSSNTFNTIDDIDDQQGFSATAFYEDDEMQTDSEKKRGIPIWLLILLILLGIAALVLGVLLLTKKGQPDVKQVAVQSEKTMTAPSESVPAKPETKEQPSSEPSLPPDTAVTEPPVPTTQPAVEPVIQEKEPETVQSTMPEPPAVKEPMASAATGKAIRYKLRWGDTLWDLSETYYRNPWLYTKIAAHNKLKNPDWVISGTYIEIPPQ